MKNLSRRSFLQNVSMGAGSVAVAAALPSFMLPPANFAGKKLNIALVGLGRYATYLAEGIAVSQYCRVAGIVTVTQARKKCGVKNIISLKQIFITTRILMKSKTIKTLI